jgi:hypothetical protein
VKGEEENSPPFTRGAGGDLYPETKTEKLVNTRQFNQRGGWRVRAASSDPVELVILEIVLIATNLNSHLTAIAEQTNL